MKIYKFGGASLQNADYIKKVVQIILSEQSKHLIIVVSAMGKTTNALELLHQHYMQKSDLIYDTLEQIKSFHFNIINQLFEPTHEVHKEINSIFNILLEKLSTSSSNNFDFEYDQIVIYGEIISSVIVYYLLRTHGINLTWIDIRRLLKTNSNYRDASVLYEKSLPLAKQIMGEPGLYICQGFIGSDELGNNTTLGREGSDYTAAALAYMLDAESVTIWKDVPGVLNGDPRIIPNVCKLDKITYKEAIELAYYGAQVIHPKTIKPLQNKNIPLFVKPFLQPHDVGTVVQDINEAISLPPIYIHKFNQVLISIMPKDFSFIAEDNLSIIFMYLSEAKIKVNMMQLSAVSFSICIDYDDRKIPYFLSRMKEKYDVVYNTNLTLITIRHYNQHAIDEMIQDKKVLLKEISRKTARIVLR
ncbi:MAG: aspartate kinase [Bacteroidales bacterium]|nr:aspartate kinase [Bacteroidales bacterium]